VHRNNPQLRSWLSSKNRWSALELRGGRMRLLAARTTVAGPARPGCLALQHGDGPLNCQAFCAAFLAVAPTLPRRYKQALPHIL